MILRMGEPWASDVYFRRFHDRDDNVNLGVFRQVNGSRKLI
jgi:hypothetical protein